MRVIQRTARFAAWLDGLKDRVTRARLVRRLEKAQRGPVLVVMLGGGVKRTQQADIAAAQALAATIEE